MGILADKMLDYMVSNKYIDKFVQKGFLKKTPGCLEHTQVLMEELKDAKSTRRQIIPDICCLGEFYECIRQSPTRLDSLCPPALQVS